MYLNNLITDGVFFVAENRLCRDNSLVHAYVGHKQCGPMLQYASAGEFYDGFDHVNFTNGAWTPIYSRGDFGKNFACGGNWSVHSKSTHPRLMVSPSVDTQTELLVVDGELMELPTWMRGDITKIEIDCSPGWPIFYPTALDAIHNMLRPYEISASSLPWKTKKHLTTNLTSAVRSQFVDKIEKTIIKPFEKE